MNFRDYFIYYNFVFSLFVGISGWKKGEIKIFFSFYFKFNFVERLKL